MQNPSISAHSADFEGDASRWHGEAISLSPKTAFGIDRSTPVIWIGNLEAERYWASPGTITLPSISNEADVRIVNALEEMLLLIADPWDIVILREKPDLEYLDYLHSLNLGLCSIVSADAPESTCGISELILNTPHVFARIANQTSRQNVEGLLPFAKTAMEDRLGELLGLPVIGAPTKVLEIVNSKIFSRQLSTKLALTTIPGRECTTFEELNAACHELLNEAGGHAPIVMKEAMGVSGKGLVVLENEAKMSSLLRTIQRRAEAGATCSFVIERWLPKKADINYQLFVAPSGSTAFVAIKEAIVKNGVHLGHRFPVRIEASQLKLYEEAAYAIGTSLRREGFWGLVGIDSIITADNTVIPLLEINARLNMSSFQLKLDELIPDNNVGLARSYRFTLSRQITFQQLIFAMGQDVWHPSRAERGVIIMNFCCINCNFLRGIGNPKGRLYALITGKNDDEVAAIEARVSQALESLGASLQGGFK